MMNKAVTVVDGWRQAMKLIQAPFVFAIALTLVGCTLVRQQDLDAWVGVPVEALDTHSIFITIPMYRTFTTSGIEIRNYVNSRNVAQCFGTGGGNISGNFVSANTFSTCSNIQIACNNIFYIKDGVVIEYAPTGRCYTNKAAQPQERYQYLKK